MTSISKWGEAIGEGAGVVDGESRYAKFLNLSGIAFAPPNVKIIARPLYDDEGGFIQRGYVGGVAFAQRQIDDARTQGVLNRVWCFEGFNECWSGDPAELALVMQAARGYADTIIAAGFACIAFSIQVGNGPTEAQQLALRDVRMGALMPSTKTEWDMHDAHTQALLTGFADDFQYLFSIGAHIAYHGYWGPPGPEDNWLWFAGRYQAIAAWLVEAGVTATQIWDITELGYERLSQYANSKEVHLVGLPESVKIDAYVIVARKYDEDKLVGAVTPFTYCHRARAWMYYDLSIKPNGQPWQPMRDAQAAYIRNPGAVNDPPATAPPQPGTGGYATVTSPIGLRVRETPDGTGRVLGLLPFGARVQVRDVAGAWARLVLAAGGATLTAGASDPDPHGYAAVEWLRFE